MSLFFEDDGVDTELSGATLGQGEGGLCTFAHDLTKLACQDQRSFSRRTGCFNEENIAADRRPGQSGSDSWNAGPHGDFVFEPELPKEGCEILRGKKHLGRAAFRNLNSHVAESLADLPFKITNAGLVGIPPNDEPQCS